MNLETLVRDNIVLIDTSTLMQPRAADFLRATLAPVLRLNRKQVIVPQAVFDELKKESENTNPHSVCNANKALGCIDELKKEGLLEIRGERNDPGAFELFVSLFKKLSNKNLILLTQNPMLAGAILKVRNLSALGKPRAIETYRLEPTGTLQPIGPKINQSTPLHEQPSKGAYFGKPFRTVTGLPHKAGKIIPVQTIPANGDWIASRHNGRIQLGKNLGSGGEGTIYQAGADLVCKVYKLERITEDRLRKIELMLTNPVKVPGICWPVDIALNTQDKFIGFLMPPAEGIDMRRAIFTKQLLEKNFPKWNRTNLVRLAQSVIRGIDRLHSLNIFLGDINPGNFLIKSDSTVCFVDTDSFQIEDFSSAVGMISFTAPEIQGKNFGDFLRTEEHENFAIAALLFMILLPGKPPYSQQGGSETGTNIKRGNFPYRFEKRTQGKTPAGPWRFIWSHLPYKLKKGFYECFTENRRPPSAEWLVLLDNYLYQLESRFHDSDRAALEIFPTTFKIISKHAQDQFGLDASDQQSGMIDFVCGKCRQKAKIAQAAHDKLNGKPPYCRECRIGMRDRQTKGSLLQCVECQGEFLFSYGEQDFYKEKSLDRPKKCPKCRRQSEVPNQRTEPSSGDGSGFFAWISRRF